MFINNNKTYRNLPEQVEYITQKLNEIKSIDFTQYLTSDIFNKDVEFGKNLEVDGKLTINSTADVVFKEGGTIATTEQLKADYNTLDTKIEANTALIDTKQDKGDYALKSEIPSTSNLATKDELKADYNTLNTKIEANTALIDTKQNKGDYALKSEIPSTSNLATKDELNTGLASKQSTLVSGTNIKTINGISMLGSGNVVLGANVASKYFHLTYCISSQYAEYYDFYFSFDFIASTAENFDSFSNFEKFISFYLANLKYNNYTYSSKVSGDGYEYVLTSTNGTVPIKDDFDRPDARWHGYLKTVLYVPQEVRQSSECQLRFYDRETSTGVFQYWKLGTTIKGSDFINITLSDGYCCEI